MAETPRNTGRKAAYDTKALGHFIRSVREGRGQSLSELARQADIAKQALSNIESGSVVPSLVSLASLANAFGIELTSLVQVGQRSAKTRPRHQVQIAIEILEELDDRDLELITVQARAILRYRSKTTTK